MQGPAKTSQCKVVPLPCRCDEQGGGTTLQCDVLVGPCNENKNKDNINVKAEIISYQSSKFEKLRLLDSISNEQIMESLSLTKNRSRVFKAGEGAGKSGSFFFFS